MRYLALPLAFACCVQAFGSFAAGFSSVRTDACLDAKAGHVQGMCTDGTNWYFGQMTRLTKVDASGKCVRRIPAVSHTGDVCFWKGRVYTSVMLYGGPNAGKGMIQVYDSDLNLLKERLYPKGFDGITCLNGKLYVGQGVHTNTVPPDKDGRIRPNTPHLDNEIAVVDAETLELERVRVVNYGEPTKYGVQTMANDGKCVYCCFYAGRDFVALDPDLNLVRVGRINAGTGMEIVGEKDGEPRFAACRRIGKRGDPGDFAVKVVCVEVAKENR